MIAAAMQTTVMPTSQSENENCPTNQLTPRSLNHETRWSYWRLPPKSKRDALVIQMPTSMSESNAASEPSQYEVSGAAAITSAPANGSKMSTVVSTQRTARKTTARTASPPASASAYDRTSPFCATESSREPRPIAPVPAAIEPPMKGVSMSA